MNSPQLFDGIIAARVKGVTLGQTQQREPDPLGEAMLFQCVQRIMGTGRVKPAGCPGKGGQISLIDPDEGHEKMA
jgi:hypothetical protein